MSARTMCPCTGTVPAPQPTGGTWVRVRARQTMHDGQVWPTIAKRSAGGKVSEADPGVQVAATGQWVGRCHPIGRTPEALAEAGANAALFAASKVMAQVLREAVTAWGEQFEAADDEVAGVSGADLLEWFAQWRLHARRTLAQVGVR